MVILVFGVEHADKEENQPLFGTFLTDDVTDGNGVLRCEEEK